MGKRMIYTADTEEPDCGRCDNVTTGSDEYCAECGNGYWCHYKRTEYEGENEQNLSTSGKNQKRRNLESR